MAIEKIDTVIVGAGQAGIAMSEHLSNLSAPHVILEKDRIAEKWRSGRWDSLVANGPTWHDRFPSLEFGDFDPEDFAGKEEVADYLVDYSKMINAPIRTGVEVLEATPLKNERGYRIKTNVGDFETQNLIVATGAFQVPTIPEIVSDSADIFQTHSFDYKNPEQLPEGAVLVVGAGSSGAQIAEELLNSGREVYLSVGAHDRPPRRYRGRDFVWWLGVLGLWDLAANAPDKEHVTIAVSGANGGNTVDFRKLAHEGMNLVGVTKEFQNGVMYFAPDLVENINAGDQSYLKMLDAADEYIARNGLDFPEEAEARDILPDPECMTKPISELDLNVANVNSIIWATGFRQDFSWLKVDGFDERGRPIHTRGVSPLEGLYFLGLPWQSRRGSTFIWGVWHDAKYIADQIEKQNFYLRYPSPQANQSCKDQPSKDS